LRVQSDEDLVRACAAGDPDAWRRFVDLYSGWVLRVARSTIRRHTGQAHEADAEDAASEVFRQLVERDRAILRSLRPPYHLKAWLAIVARRSVNKLLRKRRAPAPLKEPVAAPPAGEPGSLGPLLERLPPQDRLILEMFFADGRSYEEIAEALGISPESVGKAKFRALERLREMARGSGLDR
jgi:RNA polymerase sigma-70 factor (ECF subfamily)